MEVKLKCLEYVLSSGPRDPDVATAGVTVATAKVYSDYVIGPHIESKSQRERGADDHLAPKV